MEINTDKMELLHEFTEMARGKNSEELLPLFLAISQKAKQMNVTFTKDETIYLVNQLKEGLSPSEQQRVDLLINLILGN